MANCVIEMNKLSYRDWPQMHHWFPSSLLGILYLHWFISRDQQARATVTEVVAVKTELWKMSAFCLDCVLTSHGVLLLSFRPLGLREVTCHGLRSPLHEDARVTRWWAVHSPECKLGVDPVPQSTFKWLQPWLTAWCSPRREPELWSLSQDVASPGIQTVGGREVRDFKKLVEMAMATSAYLGVQSLKSMQRCIIIPIFMNFLSNSPTRLWL